MIIRRSRRLTVNMGNYESYTFGAEVEMGHKDLGMSDADLVRQTASQSKAFKKKLLDAVMAELEEQLVEEVASAQQLSSAKRSFIQKGFGMKDEPRRRRRTPSSDSPYS